MTSSASTDATAATSHPKPNFTLNPRQPLKLQAIHSYKKVRYKKTLHRIGGVTWRLQSMVNAGHSISSTLTDYLRQGAKIDAPFPPRHDWARLAYGTLIDQGQKNEEQEWGPAVRAAGIQPVVSFAEEKKRREEALASEREDRIKELEEAVARGKGEDGDAVAELRDLKAAGVQEEVWEKVMALAGRKERGSGGGRLMEAPNFKARTKLQSKNDIKKFEKEKRKKQSDKEESRKRRLRNYLQRVSI